MAEKLSGATVTVGCKLPHGIILHVYDMVDVDLPVMAGGVKTVKQAQRRTDVPEIRINGNAVPYGKSPRFPIIGKGGEFTDGVALTRNVPKDIWDKWLADNRTSDLVKNGLIFAYESEDKATAAARDHSQKRSGLEPLSQQRDPRAPRGSRTQLGTVGEIETSSKGADAA